MQKISSIIPSNNRISTVDMQKTSPVRSGVPAFGRAVVAPSNHNPLAKTTLEEAAWTYERHNNPLSKMQQQSKMVEDLAEDFFNPSAPKLNASPDVGSVDSSAPAVGSNLDLIA